MAVTQTTLDEARQALHDLTTGKAVAKFRDQNGEEVTYSAASRSGLIAYIADLERMLGLGRPVGPMRVWF